MYLTGRFPLELWEMIIAEASDQTLARINRVCHSLAIPARKKLYRNTQYQRPFLSSFEQDACQKIRRLAAQTPLDTVCHGFIDVAGTFLTLSAKPKDGGRAVYVACTRERNLY